MKRVLFAIAPAILLLATESTVAQGQSSRCDIPREARDIWRCENGFVIGPENVIIRLPIPDTDPEALYRAGLEAAQREDWRVAIAYFTAAYQRAHLVPRYMYNLGLAHARAGHDIPAVAWLVAYLIAEPQTPNRAAVWSQILTLENRADSAINQIWDRALSAARALPAQGRDFAFADYGLPGSAARARDWERLRALMREGEAFAAHSPGVDPEAVTRLRLQILRSDTALAAAIEDGDFESAQELAAEKGIRLVEPERSQVAALRDSRLLGALGRQEYAPEFMALRTVGCSHIESTSLCGIDRLARSGAQDRARIAADVSLRELPAGDHLRCHALAALRQAREALNCISSLQSVGFGGMARERTAASVGEILLLAEDVANAERALRLANEYANGNTNMGAYNGAPHLNALLLAERGRSEAAIEMLDVEYSRNLSPFWLPSGWSQIRYDSRALLAEYLLNRGRIGPALALAAGLDSIRRLAFLEMMQARMQDGRLSTQVDIAALRTDALAAASGGDTPPSPERRIPIENAAISALTISPASYDTPHWLEGVAQERNASLQVNRIAEIAEGNARALRRAHMLYQRAGGTWGQ